MHVVIVNSLYICHLNFTIAHEVWTKDNMHSVSISFVIIVKLNPTYAPRYKVLNTFKI